MKELTRVVTPETEEKWIAVVRGKTCGEVQAMVSGRKRGDAPEDPDQPDLRLLSIEGRAPDAVRFEWRTRAHGGTKERHGFSDAEMRTQAREALVGLGWEIGIARAAVHDACARVDTEVAIDVLIREALRRCPRPTS